MKNLSHLIFISLIAALSIIFCACGQPGADANRAGPVWQNTDHSLIITVDGFTCTYCTEGFKSCMEYNDGIVAVFSDLEKKENNVFIEYDRDKVSPHQFTEMVDQCGFSTNSLKK